MTDRITAWLHRAAQDPEFAFASRGLDLPLTLRADGQAAAICLCAAPAPTAPSEGGIVLDGSAHMWDSILCAHPQPGFHSFGALIRNPDGPRISCDPVTLAQALGALERLIELARPAPAPVGGFAFAHDTGAVTGRHQRITLPDGTASRIHRLEAGQGDVPILFLHTAGADSRQFLHQLADVELHQRYRLLAFDMPWHGFSSGENDVETTAHYTLTEARYTAWIRAFVEQVVDAPVILVGCSMGASIALTMAARHPELLRGAVALEAPLVSPGRKSDLLADARVANGVHNPAYVRAMLGPDCPQRQRDEACAIYSQARPGVYMGDLAYYSEEYDGRKLAPALRTCGVRIELLTGSYDYSAPPDSTRALMAEIGGAHVTFHEMPGLGHFPMIEDPDRFRPWFLDALARLNPGGQ